MSAATRLLIPLLAGTIALLGVVAGQAKAGVALGAVLAATAVLVTRPVLVAALVNVMQSWGTLSLGGPNATPFKGALYLLLLQVAYKLITRRRVERLPVTPVVGLVALLSIVFLSEFQSAYGARMEPLEEFAGMGAYVFCLTQVIRSGADVRIFAVVLMFNGLCGGIWGMREVPWSAMMGADIVRAGGPPGQSNSFGEMMSRAMPFAIAVAADRANPAWLRATGAAAAAATLYGLFASASRGGTVGYVGALLVFTLGAAAALDWRRRFTVLAVFAGLVAVTVTSPPKSFERRVLDPLSGKSGSRQGDWTSERLDHIALAQTMIPERPLLGHGSGGFIFRRAMAARGRSQAPHSVPLGVATGYGLPAAALHQLLQIGGIVAAYSVARRWRRHRIYALAVAAATAAVFLQALSGTELFRAQTWSIVVLAYLLRLRPEEPSAAPATAPPPRPVALRPVLHGPAWQRSG